MKSNLRFIDEPEEEAGEEAEIQNFPREKIAEDKGWVPGDPPPVSVANPTGTPRVESPAMSNRPEPINVFEVGQCTSAAPTSASLSISRGSRWIAWP